MKNTAIEDQMKSYSLEGMDSSQATIKEFKKGSVLVRQGDKPEAVMLLVEGEEKTEILSGDGKTLVVEENKNRGIIGDLELVLDAYCSATVIAMTNLRVVYLPLNYYKEILLASAPFLRLIAKGLGQKLLISSYVGVRTAYFPLKKRLCSFILFNNNEGLFKQNLSSVSEKLGTSYRHLFRVLLELKNEGILIKERKGYRIIDNKKLSSYTKDMEGESNFQMNK